MKKVLLYLVILPLAFSCSKKQIYKEKTADFYYYHTEGYVFYFNIDKKLLKNLMPKNKLPKEKQFKPTGRGVLTVNNYKKVYIPGSGGKYIEVSLFILLKRKNALAWLPVTFFVNIPVINLKPVTDFTFMKKYALINYKPWGRNFRLTLKRNFELFLEIEFSFLPKEDFNKQKTASAIFKYPLIRYNGKKAVYIQRVNLEKGSITYKEGIGAFVFHDSAPQKLKIMNNAKVSDVFYFEKHYKETKKMYFIETAD